MISPDGKDNTTEEFAVATNEKRLRALVTASSDVIYSLSADWSIMYELEGRGFLKDTSKQLTGWREQNVYAGDMEMVNAAIDEAIREKTIFELEHRVNRADGTTGWTFSRAVPILDDKGNITEWFGTASDITHRKEAETKLGAFNEQLLTANTELARVNAQVLAAQNEIEEAQVALRLAINAANFGTWYINPATREFVTDARLKELFGYYPDEELSIEQALAQITDEYREYVTIKLNNALHGNGDYDVTYPVMGLHDNRLRWLRAIGNYKADPLADFAAFTGVVMDITESYLAAKKIEQAEESLRIATDSGELATWYYEISTGRFDVSKRFQEIFGLPADAPFTYEDAVSRIKDEHRKRVTDAVAASFENGISFNVEYAIVADGGKERWVRSVGKVVNSEHGNTYVTGVLADITEQKVDDLRKNAFISMVSHELKTPLTSTISYVQVAQKKAEANHDAVIAGMMERAGKQLSKMTRMINGFLNVSRLESGKIQIDLQRFDLALLMKETEEESVASITSHQLLFAPVLETWVTADRDKIGQVISNLLSNAVKYSAPKSTIWVACVTKGGNAYVSVRDEGMGISKDELPKLFNRYYRIKDVENQHISGFGIGLYLCSEIIKRHEGSIWAESEVGKGSTFHFTLPVNQ